MSRIRFQAKLNGRRLLVGNWTRAMLITLFYLLPMGGVTLLEQGVRQVAGVPQSSGTGLMGALPNVSVPSLILSIIFSVVLFLFTAPLQVGQVEWYWKLVERKETPLGEVFGWYGSPGLYAKSILLQLHILWRVALWGLAVYATPAALWVVYAFVLGAANTFLANFLLIAGMVLWVCASVVLALIAMRYFPAVYLLVEDSGRKTNDCVRTAARYAKGFRWEIIKFQLSFILWWLLCVMVFPALYVMPYYNASSAVFARHIIFTKRAKERKQDVQVQTDAPPASPEA
ncbi:DUF975 family protein [Ethanoligenens harbinense]|uniref:DUF975 domain-containing protein n=1 Tax=Ethanoligenens harbinense (strain DSM 18485 / JCM 12961 / CGMCC 1.5033 / YUAN-3) TaxID=663278 RepID=E6U730_ETHHY|nr:DUF975 family protein [Ethanoligenens harbinense]ADU28100.1 protein of unknown function DUF975 [Ethanoligenens harbinense YUAN-3]AVQ97109.1 DUF975 domain-containing protein [Ethanoligenens harbinense YUAN-3]AYF39771.1 DUF975 domain-containing protein [Ethanoligenens harbinense]AYF42603.1 DUF975 domain-containing protein [Ethanoligenens harbinense]QCN93352.1 DUF975 family protein [Ethanoligenens harbinense]